MFAEKKLWTEYLNRLDNGHTIVCKLGVFKVYHLYKINIKN